MTHSKQTKAQIIATIGPASAHPDTLRAMLMQGLDVVRLNFSWGDFKPRLEQIERVQVLEKECNCRIPIIIDLPGPRIQEKEGHTYDRDAVSALTDRDRESIQFGVEHHVAYIALSFVSRAADIELCRKIVREYAGEQRIIAKIERKAALDHIDEIIAAADAIMVARGDLGDEVPLEEIPFIQHEIIQKTKTAGKPVIVATQMLFSMVENETPTRAEVTDVAHAVFEGADAVMLSEETAKGKYPVEVVAMMERIIVEAERHMDSQSSVNPL